MSFSRAVNFARKLASLDTTQLLCSGEVGNRGLKEPADLESPLSTDDLLGREYKKAERENRHIANRNDRRWMKYRRQDLAKPMDLAVYLMNEEAMN